MGGAMKLFKLFGEIGLDGVNEVEKDLDDVGKKTKQLKDNFKKNFDEMSTKVGDATKKIGLGLAAIATGGVTLVESTKELRQDLGKLETTFLTTGHGTENATNTFKQLYAVLGEDDTAIEASNHLALMTTNEKELNEWTNILTGVYATFGDSLPLEGLAEAANETARVGQVTGPLADALNWLGVSEDEFNEKLEKTNSESERNALIRETLTSLYGEASATYKETNESVMANNTAQAELNLRMAEMAEKIEPVITKGKILLSEVLIKLEPVITWFIDNIDILGPIILGVVGALTLFSVTMGIVNAVMMASPITWIVLAIVAAITVLITIIVLLVKNWDKIKDTAQKVWNKIKEIWGKVASWFKEKVVDPIVKFFTNLWTSITNIWNKITTSVSNAIDKVKSTVSNVFNSIKTTATNVWNGIFNAIKKPIEKARDTVKGVIDKIKGFFNFKFSWPKLSMPKFGITPDGWKVGDLLKGSIPKLSIKWNKEGAIFNKPTIFDTQYGFQGAGEAGPEAIAPIDKLMSYTRLAVSESNYGLGEKIDQVIYLLKAYLPTLTNLQVVLSTGELVGALTNPMDKALGEKADSKRRGR